MPRKQTISTRPGPAGADRDLSRRLLRRSTRNAPLSKEIRNTSDMSSDELISENGIKSDLADSKWPKVIVPTREAHEAVNLSTTSSAGISPTDDSSVGEDETPLTSAAATPFEARGTRSLRKRPKAVVLDVKSSAAFRRSSVQGSGRAALTPKLSDEQLARQLQQAEYADESRSERAERSRRLLRGGLVGSDDELSGNEDDVSMTLISRKRSVASGEEGSMKRQRTQHVIGKASNVSSRLPIRHARLRARHSLEASHVAKADEVGPEAIHNTPGSETDLSFQKSSETSDSSLLSEPDDFEESIPGVLMQQRKLAPIKAHKPVRKMASRTRHPKMIYRASGESRADYERRRLDTAHPKLKTLWDDLAKIPVVKPKQTEQPAGINRTLKSFQLEGVNWMRRMETDGQWKGGLLGDEMGMGKTIQAVSLIMSDYPANKPTLVVVPPVALMQWSSEIKAYTDGKLKVLIHHNTDPKVKTFKVKDLLQFDVIMISYSGLESIHRKEVKGWKRDDGLVKENSRIHAIHYHRLILDEAHSIKTRTTQVAKACFALKADYKWCLSGTPVQNRIGEFFSLLRFLEVEPFANYFCKECSCESLHWSQDDGGRCSKCSHTGFEHVSLFNQELLNPITSGDSGERTSAMRKLRLLTDRIMLRRMKRDHTSSMELPPKKIIIHNEFFGPEERDFSRSIMTNTTRQFDTYVARGVELNNYANIFGLIMQMRQVANHPDLILKKNAHGGQNILVCSVCDEPAEEPIRSQCHHEFCRRCAKDYVRSFSMNAQDPDCPRCHIKLRIDFDQPDIEQEEDVVKKSSIINRIKMEDWHSSSKIEMLIYELFSLRSPKRTIKSIVFSQFTSMLQLVEWRLRRAGFSTVMLDGSMGPSQRQNSIEHFMNNVGVEVFLVSLKAGGVALNLTEASRVFIVDPWWNPAAEWQSADRCHRIGQKRPCQITRLCIEDSVESRMVLLQEKKANLINGTVNGDDVALGKLTPEDLQFLFKGA